MSDNITSLPGLPWNAHAALMSAKERVPIETELLIAWFDADGVLRWSHSCKNIKDIVSICEYVKLESIYG